MKVFTKKLTLFVLSLCTCLGISVVAACGGGNKDNSGSKESVSQPSSSTSSSILDSATDSSSNTTADSSSADSPDESGTESGGENSSSTPSVSAYLYRISVRCGNFPFSGVTVELYDGETLVASKNTTSSGYAFFTEEDAAKAVYTVKASNLPAGYALDDAEYKTTNLPMTEVIMQIKPQGVIKEEAPEGNRYALGDVMHDFTATTPDGTQYTLSQLLKEKELVVLNFWATWCGPCTSEFPAMNSAYIMYQDKIELLAFSVTDTNEAVRNYKATSGLAFPMIGAANQYNDGVMGMFYSGQVPLTAVVDRNGVIVYHHTGSMTAVSDFTNLFDNFLGDGYETTIMGNAGGGENDGGNDNTNTDVYIEPTEEIKAATPDLNQVKEALKGDSGFEYRWQSKDAEKYDKHNWPWFINEDADGRYIYSSNSSVFPSYATIYADFTAQAGQALVFDYVASSEKDSDILYVLIDGAPIYQLSGAMNPNWQTCYAYVFKDYEAGEHELTLLFMRDSEGAAGDNLFKIKNLRFQDASTIDPNVDANIFRYAATELNDEPNATTKYKRYITPVYSEDDGYYHVGSKDGAILFANLMLNNPWNETSLWMLAYNGYCVMDGINLISLVEEYAWQANNNLVNYGYVPVTKDLQMVLDTLMQNVTYGKTWDGAYHPMEWLEVCVYYEHYGDNTPQYADPMSTISFHAAKQVYEGSNEVNVIFPMNPRGFKHKFIPEKSGVYHVYSTANDTGTACFLMASDTTTLLGIYEGYITPTYTKDYIGNVSFSENFNFYYYMEAGETYYLLCTTFLDVPMVYNMEIEYVGDEYQHLTMAAYGFHTYNEATGEEFIDTAISYEYADPNKTYTYANGETKAGDGYYHHVYDDGVLGSIIYLRTDVPSSIFTQNSLYDICLNALSYAVEDRYFYINGVDYTEALMKYCAQAGLVDGELNGFIAVDEELLTLLRIITTEGSYEGMKDTWLMLCYYYLPVNANGR